MDHLIRKFQVLARSENAPCGAGVHGVCILPIRADAGDQQGAAGEVRHLDQLVDTAHAVARSADLRGPYARASPLGRETPPISAGLPSSARATPAAINFGASSAVMSISKVRGEAGGGTVARCDCRALCGADGPATAQPRTSAISGKRLTSPLNTMRRPFRSPNPRRMEVGVRYRGGTFSYNYTFRGKQRR